MAERLFRSTHIPVPYPSLDPQTLVAPQVGLDALGALPEEGVVVVISHRPDGEEPGQPSAAQMAAAAAEAGLRFVHAPVHGMPDDAAVGETARVLSALEPREKALMFCRSGMRSAVVWALAMRSLDRAEPDQLRAAAASAGYDLSRLPL